MRAHAEMRANAAPLVNATLRSPGKPLDAPTRAYFESRFAANFTRVAASHVPQRWAIGRQDDPSDREADRFASDIDRAPTGNARADLSAVRVHTDSDAAASARAMQARAYTIGSHIVFGGGEYAPQTNAGRELLAHELAHTGQQDATPVLRRKLVVSKLDDDLGGDPKKPGADPAATLTDAQRNAIISPLVANLCDGFSVNGSGEVVPPSKDFCKDPAAVAAGAKSTGCCCLCIMSDPARTTWKLEISENEGAHTHPFQHRVVVNPTASPIESMGWSQEKPGNPEHRVLRPRQITLGHELCGHAALLEIDAHPAHTVAGRLTGGEHDPTIEIEKQIWAEQGLPKKDERGLAASGKHRGESFSRLVVSKFPLNSAAIPASETAKVKTAATFIMNNDWFVDVVGHSDPAGTATEKQDISDKRAQSVFSALLANKVTTTTKAHLGTTVDRFTSVKGVSDSEPPAGNAAAPHEEWRRAEIFMANFPAGAAVPPPGTPTAVVPAVPEDATKRDEAKKSPDACIKALATRAWP